MALGGWCAWIFFSVHCTWSSLAPSLSPTAPTWPTTSPTSTCDPAFSFSFTGTLPPSQTNFTRVLIESQVQDRGLLCDLSGDSSVYAVLVDDKGVVGPVTHSSYFCPVSNRSSATPFKYGVTFGGDVGANFSFRCCFQEVDLKVAQYDPKVFTATSDRVFIFFFDVNRKEIDISAKPLAVVVESDSDSTAMLYISREVCPTSEMLLKGSQDLPRLTFSRKGRIHLSKVSNPPLENGRWFVTVRLLSPYEQKTMTLYVLVGSEYANTLNSTAITVVCGVVVTLFVLFFSFCVNKRNLCVTCSCFWDLTRIFLERTDTTTAPSPAFSFPWFVSLVVLVLSLGALQFVVASWQLMGVTGDRDKCFYNEQCYHPARWDLPYNNIMSNVIYVIAGLGFMILISMEQCVDAQNRRDKERANKKPKIKNKEGESKEKVEEIKLEEVTAKQLESKEKQEEHKPEQGESKNQQGENKEDNKLLKKFDFALFYALGISLVGEGLFSAIYHVCPTPVNFQFDSSFMFAMCSLSILASYQQGEGWGTVKAARYMLFYYVPLLWFTYLGVISDTDETAAVGLWFVVLVWEGGLVWYILSSFHPNAIYTDQQHTVFTTRTRCCIRHNENGWPTWQRCECWLRSGSCTCGKGSLVTLCALVWVATLMFAIFRFMYTTTFFLLVHILLAGGWSLGWGLSQIFHSSTVTRRKVCFGLSFTLFFVLIIIASVFFMVYSVSDKAKSPEESRFWNSECVVGYYDAHDMWHVLGGFALFFLFISVYIINPHPEFLKDSIEQSSTYQEI